MPNWEPALWAALIGAAGSLAYFSALYFGFIVGPDILARLWPATGGNWRALRISWFITIGAIVAFTFQLPQGTFAPIQAFIVGTTWPTIVTQVLTGRLSSDSSRLSEQIQPRGELKTAADVLPKPAIEKQIDRSSNVEDGGQNS